MTISDVLLSTTKELLGRACEIRTTALTLSTWQARPSYLFISLKNRKFTKDFLVWFVELCKQYHQQGKICVMDEPYLFNRKAALGVDELPEPEVERIQLFRSFVHSLNLQSKELTLCNQNPLYF